MRDIRNNRNIQPKQLLVVSAKSQQEIVDILNRNAKLIKQLAGLRKFEAGTSVVKPPNAAVGIADATEIYVHNSIDPQAERERHARIILGTAETEIAEKFAQAAKQYESNPGAMHLRGMNMLFEGLKEKGSMIIVPSSALETMNLGAIGGLAAMSQVKSERDKREPEDATNS